ncbi:monofunctional biosynthetic peptidoglycan transglycosylase [Camelimonas fluminis]|uniref:Biosynthetic peptidoglycan transglycosylase n=1 Tax=Camelimonas fluminis TaxID=1576911 RepID=A0ABV7ULV0_9HYPH
MEDVDPPPLEDESAVSARPKRRFLRRLVNRLMLLLLVLAAMPLGLMLLYAVAPPVSNLMLARWFTGQPVTRIWTPLDRMAPSLPLAVAASEDSRFCLHHGVDWVEVRAAIRDTDEDGLPTRGASTLTMQTVKNLLLWQGRSPVRKGLELPLAVLADIVWSKRRTMELYLNVAEWGDGIFGAEAAAQRYFRKSAARLTPAESARLAAILPNPIRYDAEKPSRYVATRAGRIAARARQQSLPCL